MAGLAYDGRALVRRGAAALNSDVEGPRSGEPAEYRDGGDDV
jgi:hypothetical protein